MPQPISTALTLIATIIATIFSGRSGVGVHPNFAREFD
jgi:hypothetical protein